VESGRCHDRPAGSISRSGVIVKGRRTHCYSVPHSRNQQEFQWRHTGSASSCSVIANIEITKTTQSERAVCRYLIFLESKSKRCQYRFQVRNQLVTGFFLQSREGTNKPPMVSVSKNWSNTRYLTCNQPPVHVYCCPVSSSKATNNSVSQNSLTLRPIFIIPLG
jgi:hypothetical protein